MLSIPTPTVRVSSLPTHTLAELFAQYESENLLDAAPQTRYQYQCFFARTLRTLGPLSLLEVTPDVLRAWKARLSAHCGPGTVGRYMKQLSACLRMAVEDLEWLPVHPMARVRKPTAPEGRVRCLSPEEQAAVLRACRASTRPHLYHIVVLALWTGARKNEARQLCWPEVDFAAGVVRFLKTKTKKPRSVPLFGDALQVLQDLAATRDPLVPWVFPSPDGRRPITSLDVAWRAARRAAGVQDLHLHDLRHTYASYLAMSGASLSDIATLLGHTKLNQTFRYTHLMPSHTAGVVQRMTEKFLRPPGQEGATHA